MKALPKNPWSKRPVVGGNPKGKRSSLVTLEELVSGAAAAPPPAPPPPALAAETSWQDVTVRATGEPDHASFAAVCAAAEMQGAAFETAAAAPPVRPAALLVRRQSSRIKRRASVAPYAAASTGLTPLMGAASVAEAPGFEEVSVDEDGGATRAASSFASFDGFARRGAGGPARFPAPPPDRRSAGKPRTDSGHFPEPPARR